MREAGSALSRNGIWASELFQGPQGSSLSLMKPPQPPWGVRRRPSRVSDQHCRWGSPGPPQVAHHKEPRGCHSAACAESLSYPFGAGVFSESPRSCLLSCPESPV